MLRHKQIRDVDIRNLLLRKLQRRKARKSVIIQELGLHQGDSRVDVAVLNGFIHGYEIKSGADSLNRLPRQVKHYGKVCDRVTIIVSSGHLEEVKRLVPAWWGISVVERGRLGLRMKRIRRPNPNPKIVAASIVQLLWRDEVVQILKKRKRKNRIVKGPRTILWKKLLQSVSTADLRSIVVNTIMVRPHWRPVVTPKLNGDSFRFLSKSQGCLE